MGVAGVGRGVNELFGWSGGHSFGGRPVQPLPTTHSAQSSCGVCSGSVAPPSPLGPRRGERSQGIQRVGRHGLQHTPVSKLTPSAAPTVCRPPPAVRGPVRTVRRTSQRSRMRGADAFSLHGPVATIESNVALPDAPPRAREAFLTGKA